MLRWISILVAAMVIGLMAIANFGCGGGNTPSETVDEFYRLFQDKDCQKVADLVTDTNPQLAERYINDCKQAAVVSYSLKGVTIDENGLFARVDTEVTIKEDNREITNSGARFLVKRGNDWKLTEIR